MKSYLKSLKDWLVRVVAPIGVLVIGFLSGLSFDRQVGTPVPTANEIKIAVKDAVVPLRNDVRDLSTRVATPKAPEVVVKPVTTEAVTVQPEKAKPKPKKKKPETFFFGLINKA